jgi:hypothetical protein
MDNYNHNDRDSDEQAHTQPGNNGYCVFPRSHCERVRVDLLTALLDAQRWEEKYRAVRSELAQLSSIDIDNDSDEMITSADLNSTTSKRKRTTRISVTVSDDDNDEDEDEDEDQNAKRSRHHPAPRPAARMSTAGSISDQHRRTPRPAARMSTANSNAPRMSGATNSNAPILHDSKAALVYLARMEPVPGILPSEFESAWNETSNILDGMARETPDIINQVQLANLIADPGRLAALTRWVMRRHKLGTQSVWDWRNGEGPAMARAFDRDASGANPIFENEERFMWFLFIFAAHVVDRVDGVGWNNRQRAPPFMQSYDGVRKRFSIDKLKFY